MGALTVPKNVFYDPDNSLRKDLTIDDVDYMGKAVAYDVFKDLGKEVAVPRYFLGLPRFLAEKGRSLGLAVAEVEKYTWPHPGFRGDLHDEQKSGAEEALAVLKKEYGVFLNANPGSGKTVVALWLACRLKPRRTLIMVDQDNLVQQWAQRIRQFVPDASITFVKPVEDQQLLHQQLGQGRLIPGVERHDMRGDFVICSVQSLVAHPRRLQADLLIVDECHVFAAPTFCKSIFNIDFIWSVALSATEKRPDKREWIFRAMLGTNRVVMVGRRLPAKAVFCAVSTSLFPWDDRAKAADNANLFRKIWCVPYKHQSCLFQCCICPRFPGVGLPAIYQHCAGRLKDEEFWDEALETHLSKDPGYVDWVLEQVRTALNARRNIFIFARLRLTLQMLHTKIAERFGPVSSLYVGARTKHERISADAALLRPITLATYGKAGKGLDVAEKDGTLFFGPVSKTRLQQVIGRVERDVSGKLAPLAIHGIVPFPTVIARLKGCAAWYSENGYEFYVEEALARYVENVGRARTS